MRHRNVKQIIGDKYTMSELKTIHAEFELINTASVDQSSVNTYELSYPTAVIPGNRPSGAHEIETTRANSIRLRFLLNDASDANGKDAHVTIWLWDGVSGAYKACELVLTAGNGDVTEHPITDKTLPSGDWKYVDTITVSTNNRMVMVWGSNNDDGIAEVYFDLRGSDFIFADFDCDAGSAAASDAICIGKIL